MYVVCDGLFSRVHYVFAFNTGFNNLRDVVSRELESGSSLFPGWMV